MWINRKRISGALCDRRVNVKLNGKVYKRVVRPTLEYGVDTWAVKKVHEKKMGVAGVIMLKPN